jgi:hypothetical protein
VTGGRDGMIFLWEGSVNRNVSSSTAAEGRSSNSYSHGSTTGTHATAGTGGSVSVGGYDYWQSDDDDTLLQEDGFFVPPILLLR